MLAIPCAIAITHNVTYFSADYFKADFVWFATEHDCSADTILNLNKHHSVIHIIIVSALCFEWVNFHFVKFHSFEGWSTCLAVNYDTKSNTIDFVPIESGDTGVNLCEEKTAKQLLCDFELRNQQLKDGSWLAGWKEFCEENREHYTKAVANAFTHNSTEKENGVISHYLDCEAHTDVWREIFPTYNLTNCIDED